MQALRAGSAGGAAIAVALLAASAGAQSLIHQWVGLAPGDRFGGAAAEVADVDGDAIGDVAVGSPLAAGGTGSVRVFSGANGAELWSLQGPTIGSRFGCSVASLGDVDLDGRGDLAIGACFANTPNGAGSGLVRVVSGASGATIREHRGTSAGDHFGWSVGGAGDVDQDGVGDLVAGAVDDDDAGPSSGTARIHSGATGALIRTLVGAQAQELFGYSVACAGDVDQDGVPDVVAGGPGFPASSYPGAARVYSGATGAAIRSWTGAQAADAFGSAVAGLSDVDGDGIADVLVGARQPIAGVNGYARVLSGASGAVIHHLAGSPGHLRFGTAVGSAGDVDYDGRCDFVVATPDAQTNGIRSGVAKVYSGRDGAVVFELLGASAQVQLGASVAGGRDVTGNGVPDIVLGAIGDTTAGAAAGAVYLHAGNDVPPSAPALSADVFEVSASAGTRQHLTLDAGAEHAGRRYLMLGSMTGTQPGFTVFGIEVPLIVDSYTVMMLFRPSRTPLCGASGRLDAQGRASAVFRAGSGPWANAWIGQTFWHAYLVLDPARVPVFASNAVPVTIVP